MIHKLHKISFLLFLHKINERVVKINNYLDKKHFAVRASILYYEKNKTQSEIAEILDISRSYVSQLLSYAKENNIIKISINIDEYDLRMIRKEMEFIDKFNNLKEIYIMRSNSIEFTKKQIGKFAAPYIYKLIDESNKIGIGLGTSVRNIIEGLKESQYTLNNSANKTVIQTMGGVHHNEVKTGTHSNELVKELSGILNCNYYYLNCPAVVRNNKLKKVLLEEKNISSTVNLFDEVELLIAGIGPSNNKSTLFNVFDEEMKQKVSESDAVGDINVSFFDQNGVYLPILEDNKIGLSNEQLRNISKKVIIGYGKHKKNAILGALRGGYVDILITDSLTINEIEKMF